MRSGTWQRAMPGARSSSPSDGATPSAAGGGRAHVRLSAGGRADTGVGTADVEPEGRVLVGRQRGVGGDPQAPSLQPRYDVFERVRVLIGDSVLYRDALTETTRHTSS